MYDSGWLHVQQHRDQMRKDQVKDPSLGEGDIVYVRNHGMKGRNKIQDVWDPTSYRVVQCPPERGFFYSITPADKGGPVQQVQVCQQVD